MKKSILLIILALAIISSMLISGCSEETTSVTTAGATTTAVKTTTTAATPQTGGWLKMIYADGPGNLGAPGISVAPGDCRSMVPCIENLVRIGVDGLPAPALATSWEYNADFTALTFHLRKGVKFHDGTNFDAAAAKFCLDIGKTNKRRDMGTITSIDVVDDYTLRLSITGYDASLLPSFAFGNSAHIMSPTAYQKNGKEWAQNHPVGTGPFKFVSFQRDVSVKYERFDDYWGGKAYLDGIELLIIADPTMAMLSFKSGDANVIYDLEGNEAAELKSAGKYTITTTPEDVYALLPDSMNADSPYNKLKVRQAVQYALDLQTIADTGKGYNVVCNQLFGSWNWAHNKDIVGYPYNSTKAKQLLKEAGYENGFDTTIYYTIGVSPEDVFLIAQKNLADMGIKAKIEPITSAAMSQLTAGGWKNGLVVSQIPGGLGADPPAQLVSRNSVKSTIVKGVFYPDEYEQLLVKTNAEADNAKRKTMAQQLSKIAIDDYCVNMPLYTTLAPHALYPNVKGGNLGTVWAAQYDPWSIWISK